MSRPRKCKRNDKVLHLGERYTVTGIARKRSPTSGAMYYTIRNRRGNKVVRSDQLELE